MTTTTPSIQDRIAALDWAAMTRDLDSFGCTIVKSVLTPEECRSQKMRDPLTEDERAKFERYAG